MNQHRLSDIWANLGSGNRVLGWTHLDQGDKHILIPLNGGRRWERTAPDGRWEAIGAARGAAD
jgi:hypothetical protein